MARPAFAAVLLLWLSWQRSDATSVEAWNYEDGEVGPRNWYNSYPDCNGFLQSPININTSSAVYISSLEPFDISDYSITEGVNMKLENVGGHTAELIFSGTPLYLQGGNLPCKYRVEQLHFHWGRNSSQGSEHSINGKFFPAEMHIVHSQERFSSVGLAAPVPSGLAVLSFLFKIGKDNPHYTSLFEHLQDIRNPDDEVQIPTFRVADLLPKEFDYYRYQGSLTTPPCHESAIWSVSTIQVDISESQLKKFRSLYREGHTKLVDDFRPIQPLNHRIVMVSRKIPTPWHFPG